MNGLLKCNINAGVNPRAGRADVSLRDVTIAQMENVASKCELRHAPEARGGFWEFWRKLVELRTGHRRRRVDFRLLVEALGRCRTRWGGRWKSQNRKNVYVSPTVEEPLNSKVIKSFVAELKSRKCFSCFEIPMFYLYGHSMYVSQIAMSWLWYSFDSVYLTTYGTLMSYLLLNLDLFVNC